MFFLFFFGFCPTPEPPTQLSVEFSTLFSTPFPQEHINFKTFQELEKEKLELEKTVSKKTEEYINEKNKTYPLKFKLESLQRDLKYQSDLLSEELEVYQYL